MNKLTILLVVIIIISIGFNFFQYAKYMKDSKYLVNEHNKMVDYSISMYNYAGNAVTLVNTYGEIAQSLIDGTITPDRATVLGVQAREQKATVDKDTEELKTIIEEIKSQ